MSIHTFRMGALEKLYTLRLSVATYGLYEVYGFEMVFVEMKYLRSARFILYCVVCWILLDIDQQINNFHQCLSDKLANLLE